MVPDYVLSSRLTHKQPPPHQPSHIHAHAQTSKLHLCKHRMTRHNRLHMRRWDSAVEALDFIWRPVEEGWEEQKPTRVEKDILGIKDNTEIWYRLCFHWWGGWIDWWRRWNCWNGKWFWIEGGKIALFFPPSQWQMMHVRSIGGGEPKKSIKVLICADHIMSTFELFLLEPVERCAWQMVQRG